MKTEEDWYALFDDELISAIENANKRVEEIEKKMAENADLIISDNRFGLFTRQTRCVYITHQVYMRLPRRLRIFQSLARAIHACVFKRYHEVWVPDFANSENSLAGELCHGGCFDTYVKYIGPLSRFTSSEGTPKELRRNSEA